MATLIDGVVLKLRLLAAAANDCKNQNGYQTVSKTDSHSPPLLFPSGKNVKRVVVVAVCVRGVGRFFGEGGLGNGVTERLHAQTFNQLLGRPHANEEKSGRPLELAPPV